MKIVITGGPCSGKSTLINELKKRGHYCIDEVAREILTSNKHLGVEGIQKLIFEKQIQQENAINLGLVFLDRGLVDNYAYCLHRNYVSDYVRGLEYKNRYDQVFLLERFPFQNDGVRIEKNDEEARDIHEKIKNAYSLFGYNPIEVLKMDISERADYVLNQVKLLKGGVN